MALSIPIEHDWFFKRSIWSNMYFGSELAESNGNEGVLHTPQSSRTGASLLDAV